MMCFCWGVGVFLRVFGNLAGRICGEVANGARTMCCWPCCGGGGSNRLQDRYEYRPKSDEYREQFYKSVNRDKAELLLANRQNGTFIVRPSAMSDTIGTMSVVQDDDVFHLAIRRRRGDRMIALGTPKKNERCFKDLNSLINYHVSNYLLLYKDNRTTCTLLLPYCD